VAALQGDATHALERPKSHLWPGSLSPLAERAGARLVAESTQSARQGATFQADRVVHWR